MSNRTNRRTPETIIEMDGIGVVFIFMLGVLTQIHFDIIHTHAEMEVREEKKKRL